MIPRELQQRCSTVIRLNDTILTGNDYDMMCDSNQEFRIFFDGEGEMLSFLLEQLSTIKSANIILCIERVSIDQTIMLPFHFLGDNVSIFFEDTAKKAADFNNYLINAYDEIFASAIKHLNEETKNRLIEERKIQKDFTFEFENVLRRRGKTIKDYSKDELMNILFGYVKRNYRYATELTGEGGSFTPACSTYGSTALMTYKRNAGVCTGRSKLLKLLSNNKYFNLPCYISSGEVGINGHEWNNYVTEDGRVKVYDLSYGTNCYVEETPAFYKDVVHEKVIDDILIKRRVR